MTVIGVLVTGILVIGFNLITKLQLRNAYGNIELKVCVPNMEIWNNGIIFINYFGYLKVFRNCKWSSCTVSGEVERVKIYK